MKIVRSLLLASVACAIPGFSTLPDVAMAQTAPDNSAQNKDQPATADHQDNAKADRQTLAQVRKAIITDKGLSTYAHNVKILVSNGSVTLTGPVKSDDEKQKVAADAATVVSADKVANQLTVK